MAAWTRWHEHTAVHLVGEFAFVLWDPSSRTVYAARDAMGTRPLFFVCCGDRVAMASQPAALLTRSFVPPHINEGYAAELLAGGPFSEGETLHEAVRRLPHASWLLASPERPSPRIERYWAPFPAALRGGSFDDHAAALRALLFEAVRCRLPRAEPAALFLSGGVDSSCVLGIAASLRPGARPGVRALSLVFPDRTAADERAYARAAGAHCGVTVEEVLPAAADLDRARRQTLVRRGLADYPNDDMALPLRDAARAASLTRVLTGVGGDYLFGGSPFERADFLRRGRILALARRLRDDEAASGGSIATRDVLRTTVWPNLPAVARRLAAPAARTLTGLDLMPDWLEPAFAARVGLEDRRRQKARWRGLTFAADDMGRQLDSATTAAIVEQGGTPLREDGLEPSHPLLDRRVIDFALALPPERSIRSGLSKAVLRQALPDVLPPAVAGRRNKSDFGHVYVEALEAMGGEQAFRTLELVRIGWVRAQAAARQYRRMLDAYRAGDERYGKWINQLWKLRALDLWLAAELGNGGRP